MIRSKTVCFTGHRPNKLGGYDESNPIMIRVKSELERGIRDAIEQGYDTFISGMALGVDMVAAEIVLKLRDTTARHIRLVAAVPFEGQEGKWPQASRIRRSDIIARCDDVQYVCDPGYAAWKMQRRNTWMVDNSGLVIAVWDGTKGGTGNCVEYAEKAAHSPIIVRINPYEREAA
ncbi:putative phage-like protein YoqJ [Paenibacillus jamilae]|jgi:uncharacterized phage-like protein YoqJ|uniref:SLOG family protein n=1 Tax=Paenibacillus polymyxa TaxID=1406 RepID=UPI001580E23D|nr:SLOG family protein [Paenibacillus polymyxa]MDP9674817.1 putative phage-like protein YoqJ [Paenibacillus jamilae]MBY0023812.1 DUF1273 family protein [Paenibacillus polymyxa]MBY0056484.1 DUF1273 family protein [Paenibacillus polymyxa]MBY0071831.1 DUF1273 family protein [Paenibacillus polymyxa]MBY0080603.1 DUF1273 family protein [Paenibacillus polymyxa]